MELDKYISISQLKEVLATKNGVKISEALKKNLVLDDVYEVLVKQHNLEKRIINSDKHK